MIKYFIFNKYEAFSLRIITFSLVCTGNVSFDLFLFIKEETLFFNNSHTYSWRVPHGLGRDDSC